ncbi:ras and EF-hand domain-containing protein-like [Amblyraja radiata]|uniref:ras and EF-hand domain-containing protein-like n=1 Tax=Amblyraja radiata TaxID=386614 RepID=UPI001404108C|nr:ras and EF-hand domain-containing protein-like [Amblyraja radiata]
MAAADQVFLAEITDEDEDGVSGAEVHVNTQLDLSTKVQEFFLICDRECKGFINRRDLEHLQEELPLGPEELQSVFDALDTDGNGKLTLEEFTTGFSQFLFKEKILVNKANPSRDQSEGLGWDGSDRQSAVMEKEDECCFHTLMDKLGAKNVFIDQDEVQNLWSQLQKDEPHLISNFEAFLTQIFTQMQKASKEKKIMELALKRKGAENLEEIEHLYNEMEQRIQMEKLAMFNKTSDLNFRCQKLEENLKIKEQEQEELSLNNMRLEKELEELLSEKQESRMVNQSLKRTTEELKDSVHYVREELVAAQHEVQAVQCATSRLQEEQELELYRVTEGLEREKLNLLKQMDLLREMNKHLRDGRDMSNFPKPSKYETSTSGKHNVVHADGQHVETKFSSGRKSVDFEELGCSKCLSKNLEQAIGVSHARGGMDKESARGERRYLQRIISIEEDPLPQFLETHSATQLQNWIEVNEEQELEERALESAETRASPVQVALSPASRTTPVALAPASPDQAALTQARETFSNPERLFKVILVGNSSVGKSSLLRRFCGDGFNPGICATVGIDYCVRTMNVAGSVLALQLWDTAGQERFHSVTKQFLRKTDGVVLVYDITAAASFNAVRHWLQSVQEGAGPDVLILLLANKTDLESERRIPTEAGQRVATESNLIFYECSAYSGDNINEAIMHLARLLKELEDKEKEKFVELCEGSPQQKFCCIK